LTKSTGYIALRTGDPLDDPVIQPRYFDDPRDVLAMVESVRIVLALMDTRALRDGWDMRPDATPYPGCERHPYGGDAYWACVVVTGTRPENHHSGTCKMGPDSDPDAVVDPQLRVRGVGGLRVVDTSVMPVIPAGHTNSMAFMIGEKAADMIKDTWLADGKRP